MAKTLPPRPLRPATLLVRGGHMRYIQVGTSDALFLTSGLVYQRAAQSEAVHTRVRRSGPELRGEALHEAQQFVGLDPPRPGR